MAFFGLTHVGYQEPIREHVKEPKTTPISAFRSGSYRDPEYPLPKPDQCDLPATDELPGARDDPTARYNRGPCASQHLLYHNKMAGILSPKGDIEVYRRPLTTSQDIGVWNKDEPLREKEPWTYVRRRVHLNSEMTRFVDDMAKTNPDFSLY